MVLNTKKDFFSRDKLIMNF